MRRRKINMVYILSEREAVCQTVQDIPLFSSDSVFVLRPMKNITGRPTGIGEFQCSHSVCVCVCVYNRLCVPMCMYTICLLSIYSQNISYKGLYGGMLVYCLKRYSLWSRLSQPTENRCSLELLQMSQFKTVTNAVPSGESDSTSSDFVVRKSLFA